MKNFFALTTVVLGAVATHTAAQSPPLLPGTLNISVPTGPLKIGQTLPVKVLLDENSLSSPLWAYQVAVVNTNDAGETISNVTGMQGWTNSPSFSHLGNSSATQPFDTKGDLVPFPNTDPVCADPSVSDAGFSFNTGNWTAGNYVVVARLHVVSNGAPASKAPDGRMCISPTFRNFSSQAITYLKLENGTEPIATGTPALFTTAVPLPTSVDAYGNRQWLPTLGEAQSRDIGMAAVIAIVAASIATIAA